MKVKYHFFIFLCKTIVPIYSSVYLSLYLSKKILSCSLRFIKFILILCTLRLIISFLRFLFYLAVLYLLLCFWILMWIVLVLSDNFNDFRSLLIFSNNSVVNVDVNVNVDKYLNCKFYDHDFQSKPESNSKNFNPEILFLVFGLLFYYIFLKHIVN